MNNMLEEQKNIAMKIYDLTLTRVLKTIHSRLSQQEQKDMEAIFLSKDAKKIEDFLKQHLPDIKDLFEKEAKKLEQEIKEELAL